MVNAEATSCLRFIDPYGVTVFNSRQLPVLECEITTHLAALDMSRLRAAREHQLAGAVRVGWQASVIADLREGLGDEISDRKELQEVKNHMSQVVALIGRARRAGAHTYLRFIGD